MARHKKCRHSGLTTTNRAKPATTTSTARDGALIATDRLDHGPFDRQRVSLIVRVYTLAGGITHFLRRTDVRENGAPALGGSPAVWNTCVVYFQAVLLAGYLYAHLLTTRLTHGQQVVVHGTLLAVCALALPIALPPTWSPPVDGSPVFWLVGVLTVSLAAPFFVVAATGPLLQRWFSHSAHPAAKDPYFLYSAATLAVSWLSLPTLCSLSAGGLSRLKASSGQPATRSSRLPCSRVRASPGGRPARQRGLKKKGVEPSEALVVAPAREVDGAGVRPVESHARRHDLHVHGHRCRTVALGRSARVVPAVFVDGIRPAA